MPSGTTHIQGFSARHSNMTNQWGIQLAGQYNQGGTIFTRGVSAGTWSSWYKIWTEATDGVSSGLDADLLDGLSSASFQRDITGSCSAGASIRLINNDGTVLCEVDDAGDNLGNHTATKNLNMAGFQVTNMRLENRTSDPASPAVGQIWLRTDL